MNTRRIYLLFKALMTLSIVVCLVDRANAQDVESGRQHHQVRLDVQFPGGTLIKYVDAVRKAHPKGVANIVVMPDAELIEIPPISLVEVKVSAAMDLLDGVYILGDGREVRINVDNFQLGSMPDMVFKVVAEYMTYPVRSSVWSLDEALSDGRSEVELLAAIEVVLSMFSNKAEIKFHPPTKLLIARGTDEQLDLVRGVIEQLIASLERKRERIHDLKSTIDVMMEQHHEFSSKLIDIDSFLSAAKHNLSKMVNLNATGQASEQDVNEAKRMVNRSQAKQDMMNNRINRLNHRLEEMRQALSELEKSKI